jgi:exodeoxyribonuclease VII small subunit
MMAKDLSKMTYEEARDELQQVVAQLEQQSVTLDASMALWERGEALAKVCEEWLSGAKKKLESKKDSGE